MQALLYIHNTYIYIHVYIYIYPTYLCVYIYICTYTINAPTKELPLRKVRCKGHNDAGMYENMVTSPHILKGSGIYIQKIYILCTTTLRVCWPVCWSSLGHALAKHFLVFFLIFEFILLPRPNLRLRWFISKSSGTTTTTFPSDRRCYQDAIHASYLYDPCYFRRELSGAENPWKPYQDWKVAKVANHLQFLVLKACINACIYIYILYIHTDFRISILKIHACMHVFMNSVEDCT